MCLYRSPSQNREQFHSFCDSLDILMNNINSLNPAALTITGDFNGKCSKWYSFNTNDNIGKEFDTITSTTGYSQIIDKSLCSSCHHDIIHGKINFRVPLPPPHFGTIWDYKVADASSIQRAIENLNCQFAFESKTINEKVQVFSEVFMNVFSNLVPQKLLKSNHKQPPWMNPKISSSLRKHAKLTKLFYKNPSDSLKELLMSNSTECSNLRCQNHVISRSKLLKNVCKLDQILRNHDDDHLIHILLYGSEKFNFNLNKEILQLTICYLKDTERFDEGLFFLFVVIIIITIILLHRDVDF